MSTYKLSNKSLNTLNGVNDKLVSVVKLAITKTSIDFRVGEGLRTKQRQLELFKAGKSQTLNSKHITGHAVDLIALKNNKVSWDMDDYVQIAEAVRLAAIELNVPVCWGGCWIGTLNSYPSAKEAMDAYIKHNKKLKKSVFLDGPHFELV